MSQQLKRAVIIAAIAVASIAATVALSNLRFFQLLNLKAQDVHFVLRGAKPARNIVLIGVDDETLNQFPEPSLFWQRYFADAITAAAERRRQSFRAR